MRIALLSNIHGNLGALDAVLTDIAALGGVDQTWILGDLVALGAQPVGVLERLAHLPSADFTCRKMRHPAAGYITSFLRGERSVYVRGWLLPPVAEAERSAKAMS
jgi:hypothetical protein